MTSGWHVDTNFRRGRRALGIYIYDIRRNRSDGVYTMPNGSEQQEYDTDNTVAARWLAGARQNHMVSRVSVSPSAESDSQLS
jgi:hypothetical protein